MLPHRRSAVKPGLTWAGSARRARLRHRFEGSSRQAGSPPEAPDRGLRGTTRRTRVHVNPGLTAESTRLYRTAAGIGRVNLPHTSPFANLPRSPRPDPPTPQPALAPSRTHPSCEPSQNAKPPLLAIENPAAKRGGFHTKPHLSDARSAESVRARTRHPPAKPADAARAYAAAAATAATAVRNRSRRRGRNRGGVRSSTLPSS